MNKKLAEDICFSPRLLRDEWANFVLSIFFLIPILFKLIVNYEYVELDLLFLYVVGISFLWLLVIRFNPLDLFKTHILLFPFYVMVSVDIFMVFNFKERFSAGYIFILLTNYKEFDDFFLTYWGSIVAIVVIFLIIYAIILMGIYKKKYYKNNKLFFGLLLFIILGYSAYFCISLKTNPSWKSAIFDLIAKDQSIPMGYLSQIGVAANLYFDSEEMIAKRDGVKINAISMDEQSGIEVVVFVIGESSRPQNWSLFGYRESTTPELDKKDGIYKFDNMCTTAPLTAIAVPSMLSFESINNWESIVSNKSLVSVLRAAGYETYWLSTQEVDGFGGIIPHIAMEAEYQKYFSRSYDGALLPEFNKILLHGNKKQAVFIHTKGSHFDYARRYPEDFNIFKTISNNRANRLVAEYNNSILYTDWLLGQFINQLQMMKKTSILIYSSDHGENLMDDDRKLLGHGFGNEYDLSTSAFIWVSSGFDEKKSMKTSKLKKYENTQVSISSLPHTLVDILGVNYGEYKSTNSLVSDDLLPSKCLYKKGSSDIFSFDFQNTKINNSK